MQQKIHRNLFPKTNCGIKAKMLLTFFMILSFECTAIDLASKDDPQQRSQAIAALVAFNSILALLIIVVATRSIQDPTLNPVATWAPSWFQQSKQQPLLENAGGLLQAPLSSPQHTA